jgi:cytochrome d ubiquinol oxidase subunit I
MFNSTALHLARIQFAFTVGFHIIFPAITIDLASFLAVVLSMAMRMALIVAPIQAVIGDARPD